MLSIISLGGVSYFAISVYNIRHGCVAYQCVSDMEENLCKIIQNNTVVCSLLYTVCPSNNYTCWYFKQDRLVCDDVIYKKNCYNSMASACVKNLWTGTTT